MRNRAGIKEREETGPVVGGVVHSVGSGVDVLITSSLYFSRKYPATGRATYGRGYRAVY